MFFRNNFLQAAVVTILVLSLAAVPAGAVTVSASGSSVSSSATAGTESGDPLAESYQYPTINRRRDHEVK